MLVGKVGPDFDAISLTIVPFHVNVAMIIYQGNAIHVLMSNRSINHDFLVFLKRENQMLFLFKVVHHSCHKAMAFMFNTGSCSCFIVYH